MRNAHPVPHGQVREHAAWRAIGAVDDRGGAVGRVYQQTGRLTASGRHERNAGHASTRQIYLELELQRVGVVRLEHVDAAALGACQKEEAGVVELQCPDLRLHLQLLQDHAVRDIHEPQHSVGVRGHEDLWVEGQEGSHGHRRAVCEDLKHLPRVDAPEPHGLVYGGRHELVLQQVEEDGSDGSGMAHQPGVHGDVGVVRGRGGKAVVGIWEVHVRQHGDLHLRPVAAVDHHCAVLGGCGQQHPCLVQALLPEADAGYS
mmetsp:Transcript_58264/g.136520  ORF Transcript_58264/g.136520 Transcript_58264/m.136520 type:complete len:259 (-) Transcript_58264:708-1484(-)